MSMSYSDHVYTDNVDKAFELQEKYPGIPFEEHMRGIFASKLDELWDSNKKLRECVQLYASAQDGIRDNAVECLKELDNGNDDR